MSVSFGVLTNQAVSQSVSQSVKLAFVQCRLVLVLYDYQFGFRKYHSTSLALIDVMDDIYQRLDNGNIVIGIYLDLQKAFDTVDHSILLAKLYNYGIRGNVYNWFKDYLYDRQQFVSIKGINSDTASVLYGVPQGSVLGPLLFLIYVNDIYSCIDDATVKLFADDTNLFVSGQTIDEVSAMANICISKLNTWFLANRLSLSLDKTCFSVFGIRNDSVRSTVELRLGNMILKQVNCCKYLGIIIDNNLTWLEHINYIYNKIIKFTSIFYKIRHILPYKVLMTIYFAFVHSHLLYGIEIYGNTYRGYLNKLIVLNNKLLRILQNAPRNTPVPDLYTNFNTLTIPDLHIFQILVLIHKFFYHKQNLPVIFTSYFMENFLLHKHDTRNSDNLHLARCKTSYGLKTVKYKGSSYWNQLPNDLKLTTSLNSFKSKLKLILATFQQ